MNHLEVYAENRSYLFALAYRMLGSVMDAEDLLQETFLRWQQTSLPMIRSPKAFLVTVVKHLCLNQLQSARMTREELRPELSSTPDESTGVLDPVRDEQLYDALSSALLVLLERLTPKERLVLLLREVFDYEYDDIAMIVRNNAASCRQMLRRAKQHLSEERSRFVASPEQLDALLRQFTNTCATGDLDALVAALA